MNIQRLTIVVTYDSSSNNIRTIRYLTPLVHHLYGFHEMRAQPGIGTSQRVAPCRRFVAQHDPRKEENRTSDHTQYRSHFCHGYPWANFRAAKFEQEPKLPNKLNTLPFQNSSNQIIDLDRLLPWDRVSSSSLFVMATYKSTTHSSSSIKVSRCSPRTRSVNGANLLRFRSLVRMRNVLVNYESLLARQGFHLADGLDLQTLGRDESPLNIQFTSLVGLMRQLYVWCCDTIRRQRGVHTSSSAATSGLLFVPQNGPSCALEPDFKD